MFSHDGKQYGGSSKTVKTELPEDPAITLACIYPRKRKTGDQRDICTPTFGTASLTTGNLETA